MWDGLLYRVIEFVLYVDICVEQVRSNLFQGYTDVVISDDKQLDAGGEVG
jgi:hypothetical protein